MNVEIKDEPIRSTGLHKSGLTVSADVCDYVIEKCWFDGYNEPKIEEGTLMLDNLVIKLGDNEVVSFYTDEEIDFSLLTGAVRGTIEDFLIQKAMDDGDGFYTDEDAAEDAGCRAYHARRDGE